MSDLTKKPTLQDLVKIPKHAGFYRNPINEKITYRKRHNGEPLKIPTGETQISKAKAFVELELEKLRSGTSQRVAKRKIMKISNPTLRDLYEEMIEIRSKGKSESTVVNYRQAWKIGLEPFWGEKHASDLTFQNVEAFKNWWIENRSDKLSEKAQDHLKMLCRHLFLHRYIAEKTDLSALSDLEEIIKKNKKYKAPGRVYTDEEQKKLLAVWPEFLTGKIAGTSEAEKQILAARIRLAILLGLRRGLRIGEVCSLERSKVDFQKGVLEVWSAKNIKWRDIPIDSDLKDALAYQIEANSSVDSKWLFPSHENPGEHITPQILSKVWHRARKLCGIIPRYRKDARFHDLRKTFATLTARLGWAPKAACEILDMTLSIYEKTYASDVGLETKTRLIEQSFGGGR